MSDPAPHKEPERQYYFIEKAKEYVRKEAEEAGRPMTFCVTTFGCQMNAHCPGKCEYESLRTPWSVKVT